MILDTDCTSQYLVSLPGPTRIPTPKRARSKGEPSENPLTDGNVPRSTYTKRAKSKKRSTASMLHNIEQSPSPSHDGCQSQGQTHTSCSSLQSNLHSGMFIAGWSWDHAPCQSQILQKRSRWCVSAVPRRATGRQLLRQYFPPSAPRIAPTYQHSRSGAHTWRASRRDRSGASSCPAWPPSGSDHAPYRHGPRSRVPYLQHIM